MTIGQISYIARDTGLVPYGVPGHDGRYGFGGACCAQEHFMNIGNDEYALKFIK